MDEDSIPRPSLEQHDRRLVPQFILDQFARGELDGRFPAAGLFFDLSGFTHLTESLMSHGTYGAEVLASLVEAVFAPLVDTVFAHGGFVAGFLLFGLFDPIARAKDYRAAARRDAE